MPSVIRDLPFSDQPRSLSLGSESVRIKPFQIIVWVSQSDLGADPFDPRTPRIPAVYDTGFNGDFLIEEGQLVRWAGIDPRRYPKRGTDRIWGQIVDKRAANLWLHPNISGKQHFAADRPSHRLELSDGILIIPEVRPPGSRGVRLPLLGMRALDWAGLSIMIDYSRRRVQVRTRPTFWPRWLS